MADELIQKAASLDITDDEILRFNNEEIRIVGMPELNSMGSLDEVLEPFGKTCLLYETKEEKGGSVNG